MALRHKKCGGNILMDVSKNMRVLTPSFSATIDGLSLGIVEFTPMAGSNEPSYLCSKCQLEMSAKNEELEGQCVVCRKYKPVDTIKVLAELSSICDSCYKQLISDSPTNAQVMEYKSFLSVSKNSPVRELTDILGSRISI